MKRDTSVKMKKATLSPAHQEEDRNDESEEFGEIDFCLVEYSFIENKRKYS